MLYRHVEQRSDPQNYHKSQVGVVLLQSHSLGAETGDSPEQAELVRLAYTSNLWIQVRVPAPTAKMEIGQGRYLLSNCGLHLHTHVNMKAHGYMSHKHIHMTYLIPHPTMT